MALKIENEKIIGTIDDLDAKLSGEIPVDRLELIYLVNSWGRNKSFYIFDINQDIYIKDYESKECYDLSKLDTSQITNMESIFEHSNYNGDISNWNVSNVSNMKQMFSGAEKFNSDIGNWDVSNVTNMIRLFNNATIFNQDISKWDVSNVTSINGMFYEAKNFNSDISNWDVSNVTSMNRIFYWAEKFNSDIGNWNISNVIDMYGMFNGATNFNQNIGKWNLKKVCYARHMFDNVKAFINRYNNGEPLPTNTNEIKEWFNINRVRMNDLDLKEKYGEEIDGFFSNFSKNHFLTECNKSSNRM